MLGTTTHHLCHHPVVFWLQMLASERAPAAWVLNAGERGLFAEASDTIGFSV